jgi:hypothetical protein
VHLAGEVAGNAASQGLELEEVASLMKLVKQPQGSAVQPLHQSLLQVVPRVAAGDLRGRQFQIVLHLL